MSITTCATRCVIATTTTALLCGTAWAVKLSDPQVLMRQGEKVAIDIPVQLAPNEQLVSANIAPERIYGVLGLSFPQSLRQSTVNVVNRDDAPVLHIAGGVPNGNAVPVVIEVVTSNGRTVRQFTAHIPPAAIQTPAAPAVVSKVAKVEQPRRLEVSQIKNTATAEKERILLENAITHIESEIASISADLKQQNVDYTIHVAALQATLAAQADASKNASNSMDLMMSVIAGILGFSLAGAYYLGKRPTVPAGSRITLSGVGDGMIQGECVRVLSESHDKPWAYRLADMMTGAPKCIEVRVDEATQVAVQNPEERTVERSVRETAPHIGRVAANQEAQPNGLDSLAWQGVSFRRLGEREFTHANDVNIRVPERNALPPDTGGFPYAAEIRKHNRAHG